MQNAKNKSQDNSRKNIYSVSQFNKSVRNLLEASYPIVWIEGEVSNLVRPASGHCYFSLKDEGAQVRCALFKNRLNKISAKIEDGKKIIVRAQVSLYEGRGDFQLIIESFENAGEGQLIKKFELLKNKLLAEGLFNESAKLALPDFPKRLGVITSPSGAVIHDIITVLNRRYPALPVIIYPSQVQGETAAENISNMIKIAGERNECDVLILARGGGSLEDLWPFNEEIVARAIFNCKIPVVSGVGHETDTTIADWVADKRAPTPTAAAVLISPDQADIKSLLIELENKLIKLSNAKIQNFSQKIDFLTRQLKTPGQQIEHFLLRIQGLGKRLATTMRFSLNKKQQLSERLILGMNSLRPSNRLQFQKQQVENLAGRLNSSCNEIISTLQNQLRGLSRELSAISPLETMARGYSITRVVESGMIFRDGDQVGKGDMIETVIKNAAVVSKVEKITKQ